MADENETIPEIADNIELEGQKRLSSKKLIFILLPIILIMAGGAGLYFSGKLDSVLHKKEEKKDEAHADHMAGEDDVSKPSIYYDMPDLIINLNDQNNRQRFLKLSISLEIASEEMKPSLEAIMPRITDQFQTYLRELRVEELRGSAGIYRLRQELLARVRSAAGTVKVRDVLFREILVQ